MFVPTTGVTIIILALYYEKIWKVENGIFALLCVIPVKQLIHWFFFKSVFRMLTFIVGSVLKIFPYSLLYVLLVKNCVHVFELT